MADAPISGGLVVDSEVRVASTLSSQTGVRVEPVMTRPSDHFVGGACVRLNGKELPVLLYQISDARVSVFQVGASLLHTTGMRPMEMGWRRFYCCSHNGRAVVVFTLGAKAYLFSGKLDEMSLATIAMRMVA